MDKVKLNAAYNSLKDAVGTNGAFVILCSSMEGGKEDANILTSGPLVLNLGMLASLVPVATDQLMGRLEELLKSLPKQPD